MVCGYDVSELFRTMPFGKGCPALTPALLVLHLRGLAGFAMWMLRTMGKVVFFWHHLAANVTASIGFVGLSCLRIQWCGQCLIS